ncbi:hypothetical protein [Olivibacter sp. XZL3]|uniref:hypothetical protein n=1 Tax=Olivibacter sp. XZL3 TaxID=1735116 RepID=UPI001064ED1F|nr:hypothetical protein [Olivibacter sp. XZL3]
MEVKKLFPVLLLFCCTIGAYAQRGENDQSFKRITLNVAVETAFDEIVDYLQAEDLFITAMDKQAGFIQAKIFVKDKRVLSAKKGEKRTFNFILRPKDTATELSLNIYVEEYMFGGDVHNRTYYYDDQGILEDKKIYQDLLDDLQQRIRS